MNMRMPPSPPLPSAPSAPGNQLALQDDVGFWSRQLTEHALFLSLMFETPAFRQQAQQLHRLWESVAPGATQGAADAPTAAPRAMTPEIARATDELIAFKELALQRVTAGEWIGWALPSFIEHLLMEARYFRSRYTGGTNAQQDVQTWLQIVKDHADVGPKLIDPKANAYADLAKPLSATVTALQGQCASALHRGCLAEMNMASELANRWVRGIPTNLAIVPKALQDHILRENGRAGVVARSLTPTP